jgi:hypothetical protein
VEIKTLDFSKKLGIHTIAKIEAAFNLNSVESFLLKGRIWKIF